MKYHLQCTLFLNIYRLIAWKVVQFHQRYKIHSAIIPLDAHQIRYLPDSTSASNLVIVPCMRPVILLAPSVDAPINFCFHSGKMISIQLFMHASILVVIGVQTRRKRFTVLYPGSFNSVPCFSVVFFHSLVLLAPSTFDLLWKLKDDGSTT